MSLPIRPLTGRPDDHDALVERARTARVTLIGEASHGTADFYRERAEITKRLIQEAGVVAVAAEADWPDAQRVNRFVRGEGPDRDAEEALGDFRRFPSWMWRTREVEAFVAWRRDWNDRLPPGAPRVGFYGLDLYSLWTSIEAVLGHLDEVDPAAADRARRRYACFDHFGRDSNVYAYETGLAGAEPCEDQVVAVLGDLLRASAGAGEEGDPDRRFAAEQNARLVVDAERYHRASFRGGSETWNLRDRHMADTLDALLRHLDERNGAPARAAVWAHNSHVGEARASELGEAGELDLGQLAREAYGERAFLIGLTTHSGTVTAASRWGAPVERKRVRPAMPDSWEDVLHRSGHERFLLMPVDMPGWRLERAIGVIYLPETERVSHYFESRLADRFDALIHLDRTTALEPIERTETWQRGEPVEPGALVG